MKLALLSMFTIASLAPLDSGVTTKFSAGWQVPFDLPHRLVRQYIQPASDYSSGHRGVDFEVESGEPLFAPADGVISVSRVIVNRGVLAMKHGAGLVSELEPACSELTVGSMVRKGDQIGWVCPGNETYVQHCQNDLCIHFSLRFEGKYLSPLALIGGLNPSRLLPYARG